MTRKRFWLRRLFSGVCTTGWVALTSFLVRVQHGPNAIVRRLHRHRHQLLALAAVAGCACRDGDECIYTTRIELFGRSDLFPQHIVVSVRSEISVPLTCDINLRGSDAPPVVDCGPDVVVGVGLIAIERAALDDDITALRLLSGVTFESDDGEPIPLEVRVNDAETNESYLDVFAWPEYEDHELGSNDEPDRCRQHCELAEIRLGLPAAF